MHFVLNYAEYYIILQNYITTEQTLKKHLEMAYSEKHVFDASRTPKSFSNKTTSTITWLITLPSWHI